MKLFGDSEIHFFAISHSYSLYVLFIVFILTFILMKQNKMFILLKRNAFLLLKMLLFFENVSLFFLMKQI